MRPRRALLSVSDKTNLIDLAKALHQHGVEILSTGGSAKALKDAGIPVKDVSEHTAFPEIMQGRVKTLHPKIHGGILGRRGTDDAVMKEHGIEPIDLVVVNLYPFQQTIAREDVSLQEAIENIDIGGPGMLRAAAKNHEHVAVVVDTADYPDIIKALNSEEGFTHKQRFKLAAKAFAHTAEYDGIISNYFYGYDLDADELPDVYTLQLQKAESLRYGENPHQQAGLYTVNHQHSGFTDMKQLQGKPLSYNNLADAQAAVALVREFKSTPACVIIKHANPCGVALAETQEAAYEKAYACDPTSAFGGIIAFNRTLDEMTTRRLLEQQFVEVIIAPEVHERAAIHLLNKPNVRVLQFPITQVDARYQLHCLEGGMLMQTADLTTAKPSDMTVASQREPSSQEWTDLAFAQTVVKHVKSNAIVYAKNGQTLGIGAGQTSRVGSATIAKAKAAEAGLDLHGAVMASDAFFPFRDSIDAAAHAGISAVIQPGGSKRDEEVIEAANGHNMTMVFTGIRHFKH